MTFCFPNKPLRFYNIEQLLSSVDLNSWIVQPKWDGHRALPYCDINGKITVYNRYGKPLQLAKNNFLWLSMLDLPRPWALDAELLRNGKMIAWDFSMLAGKLRIKEPYINRFSELQCISKKVSKDVYSFEVVESLPANNYRNYMLRRSEPELEGFVLKNLLATDMWGPYRTTENASQFKYRF